MLVLAQPRPNFVASGKSFHLSGPLEAFSALKFYEFIGERAEQRQHSKIDSDVRAVTFALVDFPMRKLLFSMKSPHRDHEVSMDAELEQCS